MITLSDLRTEKGDEWTKLVCDFTWDSDQPNPFAEKTLWFAVKKENADFLTTEVYDPFVLVPYYIAMHYGQNLKICGKVSKLLYKNLTNYAQRILQDFSDEMKPITFTVDGFGRPEQVDSIVGAGISCGVDSLSTIYDRYVKEQDPEYRISALFLFDCGTHGDFEDATSHKLFRARYQQNKSAADDLGLPLYTVETNLHAFTHIIAEQKTGYFAIWSCILCLQRKVSKYYVSSCFAYQDIVDFQKYYHDYDMDEFCGSYMLPLIQTESIRLIYDGAQYKRTEKTQNIADWDIAQKHLNVCIRPEYGAKNCSCCPKCIRTLLPLEAMGKLEAFGGVFDLATYKKVRWKSICRVRAQYGKDNYDTDNIDYARRKGIKVPSALAAQIVSLPELGPLRVKVLGRKLLGDDAYETLKKKAKRGQQ